MERNELRINNSIEVGALCCPYGIGEVAEILADCVLVRINGSYDKYLYDDISPITLTEEWLVRFGGKKNDEEITIPINRHLCISFFDSECQLITDDDFFVMDVYHVHQLQNLYFALTGEELKLT